MTPEGDYLSGYFAWAFRNRAHAMIQNGWNRFQQLARQHDWDPQPVPRNQLDYSLGKPAQPGGLKLEVTMRDLPRGNVTKPGRGVFQQCAYNISWTGFSPQEALHFVTESDEKQRLPGEILERFSKTLKDCVRGQCSDWGRGAVKQGELYTQCIRREANMLTMRVTGTARFSEGGRAYSCQLHGRVVYDKQAKRFTQFQLVASGQRRGRSQFNGRNDDPGPAPMGVAYVLYHRD